MASNVKINRADQLLPALFLFRILKCLNATRFEQRFFEGMQSLGLPYKTTDEIDPSSFTFDHFFKLYMFLCPRKDLDELFTRITKYVSCFIYLVCFLLEMMVSEISGVFILCTVEVEQSVGIL